MAQAGQGPVLVVDAANVVGAGAAGWWRDPPAAFRRLLDRLVCLRAQGEAEVLLVLDVPHVPEGRHDGVVVRHATRRGRDAADERIVALLEEGLGEDVEVVTSDRDLAERARELGARVTGAGRFLQRLEAAGC